MPIGPARMPLFDHLGELRRRLTIVVACVVAATIVMYFATPTLVDILVDPYRNLLEDGRLYIMSSLGGFSVRFSIAIKTALIMCVPMVLWQILAFFLPALRPNERKWVVPTLLLSVALFFFGAILCYFIVVPAAFEWLLGQTNSIATALPNLEDYINTEVMLMIGFGVAFELPLAVFYLAVFHIVPYASFRAGWRVIYVVMLVICASVTPDANPMTMLFMYAAMLMLYELSLLITRTVVIARDGKKGLTESHLGLFGDEDEDEDEA